MLLISLLLVLSGCGGSSGTSNAKAGAKPSSSGKPTQQTRASGAFLAGAEAICLRVNKQIEAVKAKKGGRAEILRVVPAHAAVERSAVSELERLTPPAALARSWHQILAYRLALAGELTKLVTAARANDSAQLKRLMASKAAAHKKLLTLANQVGFKSCSQVG